MKNLIKKFRNDHQNGRIKNSVKCSEGVLIVESQVYFDKNDKKYISNAFESGNSISEAQERAIIVALSLAGYEKEGSESSFVSDSDVINDFQDIPSESDIDEILNNEADENYCGVEYEELPPTPPKKESVKALNMSPIKTGIVKTTSTSSQPSPANEMTYAEAVKVIYPINGMFKGQTLGDIAAQNMPAIKWIATTYKGKDVRLKEAAKIILAAHG